MSTVASDGGRRTRIPFRIALWHCGAVIVPELSAHQKQIWRIESILRGQPHLHSSIAIRLDGHLDTGRLEHAVRCVQRRHELLRSGFLAAEDVLTVTPAAPEVSLTHVTMKPDEFDSDQLAEVLISHHDEPFPLTGEALLRVVAVTDGTDRHVLLLTMHRLVVDAASLELIVNQLADPQEDAEDAPSYFAAVQARPEHLEEDRTYWAQALESFPQLTLGDTTCAGEWEPDGRRIEIDEPQLLNAIAEQRVKHRASPFALVAASLFSALADVTGTADICIGTAFENRLGSGRNQIVGPLAQPMLLRVRAANEDLGSVLHQVKTAFSGAVAHQRVPFDDVMAAVVATGVEQDTMLPVLLAVNPQRKPYPAIAGLTARLHPLTDADRPMVRPGQLDVEVELDADRPLIRAMYDGTYISDAYAAQVLRGCLARLIG